jgi:hypothetical protein
MPRWIFTLHAICHVSRNEFRVLIKAIVRLRGQKNRPVALCPLSAQVDNRTFTAPVFRPGGLSVGFLFALLISALTVSSAQAEKNLKRPPGTTRYAVMVSRLNALAAYDKAHRGRMALSSLGESVQGRNLWMVTLHDPTAAPGKKIFYLCRQHGHEPASTEGALAFIDELVKAETPLAATVYVVPMANPDGSEAFLRHNAHDVDLNRDWLRRTQPETRALWAALERLHPDLVTDQHELYPDDTRPDFTETAGPGSGAGPELIADCDDVQAVVQGALLAEGLPTASHWITDTHPARLAHRYGCVVAGLPTILFETNRLTGNGRGVAARASAQERFMATILRDETGGRDALMAEAATWQAAHPRDMQRLASRHMLLPRTIVKPSAPTETPEKGTD